MPAITLAGFAEDDLRKLRPTLIYLESGRQPPEWLDSGEAAILSGAFREGRADRIMEVFKTGCGRLDAVVSDFAARPKNPPEPRDSAAFTACFYNTPVFETLRESGFLARATALCREFPGWINADFLDNAIESGNIGIVRTLLDDGDDPGRRFEDGATPLYRACTGTADLDVVRLLLDRGAPVDGWTAFGQTALSAAITSGDEPAVDLLLERGASAGAKTGGDETLLHRAAGRRSAAIVEKLLRWGADPDAGDRTGKTPLHYAAEAGDAESVRLLLDAGARVDARNRDGLFPLRVAVKRGRLEAVAVLLARGAGNALDKETRDRLVGMAEYMRGNYREYFGDERGVQPRKTAQGRKDIVAMLQEAVGIGDQGEPST